MIQHHTPIYKKRTFLIFLFLSNLTAFAQEIVNSIPLEPKKSSAVFQIANPEKKTVTLFVRDSLKIKAINLNEKMQIADSISAKRPNLKTYTNIIGYNKSNGNTRLFWSSTNYEAIFAQLFNTNSRETITKEYKLVLKNEKVIQKFSQDENFYILTVLKNSDIFKLYIFDSEGNYTEKMITTEGFHFFTSDYKKSDLYTAFSESLLPFEAPFSLQNITVENQTSLIDAAKKRKCYFNNKQLVITLDTNIDFTQMILIDLQSFTATEKMIKKQYLVGDRKFLNSNSFYFDNKLYQLKTSSGIIYFTIKDLEDNVLKEYFANSTKPIAFKNSEFHEQGGSLRAKRTLASSPLFILKSNNLFLGLSCYQTGLNTFITFGGVSELKQSADQTTINQFGLTEDIVFSTSMEDFDSSSNRRVVKTEGLFDTAGNRIKGKLVPLASDKISTFFDKNNTISAQTLFKLDAYYLGYYDNKTKEYIFRKFED
ncbi:hypothetical protein [Flavobacterium sp. LM4]|uniref:hypothetical protein n=1 Tax=Flavobacterium sp. LM4 TaxID=1938609 RepID=UPI00099430D1|nr:hypothetical protein [Flavobacterium sp. LM4]OOV16856.1 hypothetical protein BXU10_17985 [Flavobacterium sp. LM4]